MADDRHRRPENDSDPKTLQEVPVFGLSVLLPAEEGLFEPLSRVIRQVEPGSLHGFPDGREIQ